MSNKPPHPTSDRPILAELNDIVYKTFPPVWKHGGWLYGKLYYYGDQKFPYVLLGQRVLNPCWMLDGQTLVDADCVLGILREHGHDVGRFETFFCALKAEIEADQHRAKALRASAREKLTEDERLACHLD
jgi:hypothetical protein